MEKNNNGLTLAIIFASIVMSGSIVFFGLQLNNDDESVDLQAAIRAGIDDYVEEVQQDAQDQVAAQQVPTKVSGDFTDDDAMLGSPDAPVTIVEFSDYECPFCERFYSDTLPLIKENYIDTGKVKFIYRDYPLQSHRGALPAAMVAECARDQAGDEVYFEVHDHIFDTFSSGFNLDSTIAFAGTLGVDEGKLRDCVENNDFYDEVNADLQDGVSAGVTGTPGFLINNQRVSGAQPFSVFEAAIEDALSQ